MTASDREGLSYYSDPRIRDTLQLDSNSLRDARTRLAERELILYRDPIYQVLPVPKARPAVKSGRWDAFWTAHLDVIGAEGAAA